MHYAVNKYVNFKNAFYTLSLSLLIILPLLSLDAGISGDEGLHYSQSERVFNYFKTAGKDKSALNTPGTHLRYYGQSFDNMTTILIKWFNIEDIYRFRHISNSIVGWGIVLISGLLVILLAGYRAGFLMLLLFIMSPRFLGHTWNNLKDIPFTFGYIASIYFTFLVIKKLPRPSLKHIILLVLALAFAMSIRISGILLAFYMFLFAGLYMMSYHLSDQNTLSFRNVTRSIIYLLIVSVTAYCLALILWPFGLEGPIKNSWLSFKSMSQFPTTVRQIFEGRVYWSDQFPWYYLLKYMVITIPTIVLLGLLAFLIFIKGIFKSQNWLFMFFVLISFIFPLGYIILTNANVYGAWRQVMFIYPPLVILAALGLEWFFRTIQPNKIKIAVGIVLLGLCIHPIKYIVKNHPYEYIYFNEMAGGVKGAYGKYETDYYYHSILEATEWLQEYIENDEELKDQKLIVGWNFAIPGAFFHGQENISTHYMTPYSSGFYDWDFAIFANSYIDPYQLQQNIWPPDNTIHTIDVDGKPICAILARTSKDDYAGYQALNEGKYELALSLLEKAVNTDPVNVSAYISLSVAYLESGDLAAAIEPLNKCLGIYPDYEVAVNQLAETYYLQGEIETAVDLLIRNLENNYKYLPSYLSLAEIYFDTDQEQLAVKALKKCISINSRYKPALLTLGNYYLDAGQSEAADRYLDRAKKL